MVFMVINKVRISEMISWLCFIH